MGYFMDSKKICSKRCIPGIVWIAPISQPNTAVIRNRRKNRRLGPSIPYTKGNRLSGMNGIENDKYRAPFSATYRSLFFFSYSHSIA